MNRNWLAFSCSLMYHDQLVQHHRKPIRDLLLDNGIEHKDVIKWIIFLWYFSLKKLKYKTVNKIPVKKVVSLAIILPSWLLSWLLILTHLTFISKFQGHEQYRFLENSSLKIKIFYFVDSRQTGSDRVTGNDASESYWLFAEMVYHRMVRWLLPVGLK